VKALITGAGGQLGQALAAAAPPTVRLAQLAHAELDIADGAAVATALAAARPDVLINAGAYTRVDAAEGAPLKAERANAEGPAVLAAACGGAGVRLVHVSTDYVFDGARPVPWLPGDAPRPLCVYGASKWRGEQAVRTALGEQALIVRSSWVYGPVGGNFVTRILALARERPRLTVVADQAGAPTSTASLAAALWELGLRQAGGLYHWCDSGVASWYDFAVAIVEEAAEAGLLARVPIVVPIGSEDYPTPARRPRYSVLDKRATEALLGRTAPHWRVNLRAVIAAIAAAGAR
jgi:dTDP-4-dehydrorhamnose reductase